LKKIIKYFLSLFSLLVLLIVFIIEIQGNFYKINNDAYRSGQLNKYNLEYYIKQHNFKSILNLRGSSTKQYSIDEIALADKYNIKYFVYKI
jgi:hypothetical protein